MSDSRMVSETKWVHWNSGDASACASPSPKSQYDILLGLRTLSSLKGLESLQSSPVK